MRCGLGDGAAVVASLAGDDAVMTRRFALLRLSAVCDEKEVGEHK